jgi:glutamine amidotransferase
VIGIVDYGMGNVQSVANALLFLGEQSVITADPGRLEACDRLILPGVGAFGDAMEQLRARRLIEPLNRLVVEEERAFLGICLGMQLLADGSSEHGHHEGLGWIAGAVEPIRSANRDLKVPHMGWNDVDVRREHPLFRGLSQPGNCYYFVHSFWLVASREEDVVGTVQHGERLTAAVARGNIAGVQFHPEKSQDNGLQLLRNFTEWKSDAREAAQPGGLAARG